MDKFEPIRLMAVLAVIIAYLLIFTTTEAVKSSEKPENTESSEKTDASDKNSDAPAETPDAASPAVMPSELIFPDYSGLDVSNPLRPFENNAAVLLPVGYEEVLTEAQSTVSEPISTPDAVVSEQTTSLTDEQTSVQSVQTSPETTTSAATEEASGELLSVRYSGSGGAVKKASAEILAQVVMGEIGGSFDKEAIKAQAIASYTYIKYYNENGSSPTVSIATPNDRVRECVKEVLGQAIYHGGKLIQSVYSASSAGYTASSKGVWGVDYPYLQSKKCELDALYDPNYAVKKTFTSSEIKMYVRNATGISLEGDPGSWLAIKSHIDNVYVGSVSIGGKTSYKDDSGKQTEITGKLMREKILKYDIPSSCFEISYNADTDKFTFTTYGYGHGVGLSQNGANNLAKYWNYDYKKIIEFYFPGTEILTSET